MKTIYCLPIIKTSLSEVEKTIKKYPDYDAYEIWVDYVIPSELSESRNLLYQIPPRATLGRDDKVFILCFRRKNGEAIRMPFENRKKIINDCISKNILIDCDIEQQKEDLEYMQKISQKSKVKSQKFIVSYHNYKKTPENVELNKLITIMEGYNPHIYKIATFCQNPEEAVRLMQLLVQLKKQNKKAIVLGMGEYGKITRIFGALYGNEVNFVAENKENNSAPGQLTRIKFKNILNDLSF